MINKANTKIHLLRSHLDVTSFYSLQLPKKLNFLYINSYIYIQIQKTMILNINLNKKQNMSCHLYIIMKIRLSFQVLLVFNYKYIYSTDGIINLHIHTYYWNFTQSPKHILSKISATLIKITSCIVFLFYDSLFTMIFISVVGMFVAEADKWLLFMLLLLLLFLWFFIWCLFTSVLYTHLIDEFIKELEIENRLQLFIW
jgi:hypothetical protein